MGLRAVLCTDVTFYEHYKLFCQKINKMTLKQITEDNFSSLLRCMDPSIEPLGRLRSVPFVKDRVSLIDEQQTDDHKINALLKVLLQVPDDIEESVMNGFISALRSSGQEHVANIFRRESDKVTMSDEHHRALTATIDQLCEFLGPENKLLDRLVSTQVISLTDATLVRVMPGYNEKARKLIEVLMRKSDDAFDSFIEALDQTGQSHVSYMLTGEGISRHLEEERREPVPISDEHRRTLTIKTDQLCQFIDPQNGLLDKLVSTEVISHIDAEYIRSVSGHNEMSQKLINVLTRKSDHAFGGFINALNQTGQSHVTYLLTGEGNSRRLKEEYRKRLLSKRDKLVGVIDSKRSGLV